MKMYGGMDVYIHVFLTSALVGVESSASFPGCLTAGERTPGTHWIGWVGPRAGLDDVERRNIFTGTQIPTHRSLYRLCYPVSHLECES
jgi:hypothetical protein